MVSLHDIEEFGLRPDDRFTALHEKQIRFVYETWGKAYSMQGKVRTRHLDHDLGFISIEYCGRLTPVDPRAEFFNFMLKQVHVDSIRETNDPKVPLELTIPLQDILCVPNPLIAAPSNIS